MMHLSWTVNLHHKIVNNTTEASERVYLFDTDFNTKSRQLLTRKVNGFLAVNKCVETNENTEGSIGSAIKIGSSSSQES